METRLVTLLGVEWKGFARFAAEGSPAGTEARLERLREHLARAAADEGGEVLENPVKAKGELRVLSFPAPSAALRAVQRLGRELGAAGFDASCGLHAGECIQRDGTLLGAPIHVAARLASEAAAGEVLVTEVFRLTSSPDAPGRLEPVDRVVELAGMTWALHRLVPGEGGEG